MAVAHTVRIRGERWDQIVKKAWKLSQEADKYVKPTDVLDAAVDIALEKVEMSDIKKTKEKRERR